MIKGDLDALPISILGVLDVYPCTVTTVAGCRDNTIHDGRWPVTDDMVNLLVSTGRNSSHLLIRDFLGFFSMFDAPTANFGSSIPLRQKSIETLFHEQQYQIAQPSTQFNQVVFPT